MMDIPFRERRSAVHPRFVHGGYTDKLIDSYVSFGPRPIALYRAYPRLNTPTEQIRSRAENVVPAFKELPQY